MTEEIKRQLNELLQTLPPTEYGKEQMGAEFIRAILRGEIFFHPMAVAKQDYDIINKFMETHVNGNYYISENHESLLRAILPKICKIMRPEYNFPLKSIVRGRWGYKIMHENKGSGLLAVAIKGILDLAISGRLILMDKNGFLSEGKFGYSKERFTKILSDMIDAPGIDMSSAFDYFLKKLNLNCVEGNIVRAYFPKHPVKLDANYFVSWGATYYYTNKARELIKKDRAEIAAENSSPTA